MRFLEEARRVSMCFIQQPYYSVHVTKLGVSESHTNNTDDVYYWVYSAPRATERAS